MKTSIKKIAAILAVAAGFSTASAHAALISNGGFESGNLSGWSVAGPSGSIGSCASNFSVSSSGTAAGCTGYAPIPSSFVSPHSGSYAAYASFDGAGPLSHSLTQTFAVPLGTSQAVLSWYDALGFGSGWTFPQARVYSVDLLNSSGGVVANLLTQSYTNHAGGIFQNWTAHTVDISSSLASLSGQTASIRFNLFVPQSFTGPGAFGLDDVTLTAEVPEPASMALLGIGLLALGSRRRKSAKQ